MLKSPIRPSTKYLSCNQLGRRLIMGWHLSKHGNSTCSNNFKRLVAVNIHPSSFISRSRVALRECCHFAALSNFRSSVGAGACQIDW